MSPLSSQPPPSPESAWFSYLSKVQLKHNQMEKSSKLSHLVANGLPLFLRRFLWLQWAFLLSSNLHSHHLPSPPPPPSSIPSHPSLHPIALKIRRSSFFSSFPSSSPPSPLTSEAPPPSPTSPTSKAPISPSSPSKPISISAPPSISISLSTSPPPEDPVLSASTSSQLSLTQKSPSGTLFPSIPPSPLNFTSSPITSPCLSSPNSSVLSSSSSTSSLPSSPATPSPPPPPPLGSCSPTSSTSSIPLMLLSELRPRRHSKDESAEITEAEQNSADGSQGVHIPKEATTNSRLMRRKTRTDSDVSLELLEKQNSSSLLLSYATAKLLSTWSSSPITMLEPTVLVKIFRYLSFKNRFACRRVCKLWLNVFMHAPELSGSIDLSPHNKEIEDFAIYAIAKVLGPNIKSFCLRNCWNITDSGFQKFVELTPNLEVVDMNSCWELTDRSVSDISNCKELRRLDLSNCRKVSDITLSNVLKSTLNLEELKVSYCKNLTNTTMTNIVKNSKNLRVLYLQRCTSISDGGFQLLKNPETTLPNLTILSLSDCSFLTDEAILAVSTGCPNIRVLNLSFCCALSLVALEHLAAGCTKLVSLDLSFCGNAVDDEGLELLGQKLIELERLSFRSCIMVTEVGLNKLLEHAKALKYVNPSSCKYLTKDVLAQLPAHLKVLSGNVPLHEVAPSPYFPKTSADGKFFA